MSTKLFDVFLNLKSLTAKYEGASASKGKDRAVA